MRYMLQPPSTFNLGDDVVGAEKLEPGEIIYKPNIGGTEKLNAIFTPEASIREVVAAVKDFGTSSS